MLNVKSEVTVEYISEIDDKTESQIRNYAAQRHLNMVDAIAEMQDKNLIDIFASRTKCTPGMPIILRCKEIK